MTIIDSSATIKMPCCIKPYVPHSGRMCLLDTLLKTNGEVLEAGVVPTLQSQFATDQGVPGWIGLEWMAQAIAAWSGVQARAAGRAPAIGFLLGTRHYDCKQPWLTLGEHFRIRVEQDFQADNGLGSFICNIYDSRSNQIASAQVNVFQPGPDDNLQQIQARGFR
ncbi:hypothetical protein [Granulosicoccus antarcticus]|uniref:3-hydroxylacyl-ACP dehydratase n=1 Tax=Granulosicoccus antarcticus IMCC3135 TaxID=1192854 RepID=A0A2Z2P5R8_9GAMM|nr:hypothetical protein [Granulosicoccus antarcticus]ASJ76860.1 hypothetical protein IMCC3135_34100 [Granulosicoccus antarcticus IMCC3135]